MKKKTRAEKIQYTITHLSARMTVDLVGRRDLIIAGMDSGKYAGGCESREESIAILQAIDAILARREMAQ